MQSFSSLVALRRQQSPRLTWPLGSQQRRSYAHKRNKRVCKLLAQSPACSSAIMPWLGKVSTPADCDFLFFRPRLTRRPKVILFIIRMTRNQRYLSLLNIPAIGTILMIARSLLFSLFALGFRFLCSIPDAWKSLEEPRLKEMHWSCTASFYQPQPPWAPLKI